jgi:hypothetical protein
MMWAKCGGAALLLLSCLAGISAMLLAGQPLRGFQTAYLLLRCIPWVCNNKIIPMGNTQKLMLFIRGNAMSGLQS